ncbi:oligosaccharide flippase family protein [Methylobacterium radiodurans]|nr:oligosaccharide flippase family protein [Methylobacterium radiodurans]
MRPGTRRAPGTAPGPGSRLRTGATLLSGNMADMLFPLLRNIALAHTLPKEQYGVALSLSVVAAFAELATDIGIQYSAVRGHDEADPEAVYGTLHALALIRSTLIALVLLASAPLVVWALDVPDALWAFLLLPLAPFLRGFQNLGVKELTRTYEFWPDAATTAAAQAAWTVIAVGIALVSRDYACMLFGIVGGAAVSVLVSHLLARRRWRLAWDRPVAREAERFGRPLIPNGLANAFSIMGDRLLVGSLLGVSTLGLYGNAMGVALMPRGQLLKFLTSLYLPALVAAGKAHGQSPGPSAGRPDPRSLLLDRWAAWLSVASFTYGLGLLALGVPVIGFVFGAAYRPSQGLVSAIAVDVCIKSLLAFPVAPCLAGGQTGFLLRGSIAGAGAVLLAALSVPLHGTLEGFVAALAAAEGLVLAWIVRRSLRLHPFTPALAWFLVLFPIGVTAGLGAVAATWPMPLADWVALCVVCGLAGLGAYGFALRSHGVGLRDMVRMGEPAGALG